MADRIAGLVGQSQMNANERAALEQIIPRAGLFLEIGTADGMTAAWLAQMRPDVTVVSVDTFPTEDSGVKGVLGDLAKYRANQRPNQRLWIGTASQLFALARRGLFDVALVDGEHTYESCASDLQAAVRLVDPRGVLLAHDYEHRQNGVKQAVTELCKRTGAKVEKIIGSMAVLTMKQPPPMRDWRS
jgi:predicted O-methyltransferase YrrM